MKSSRDRRRRGAFTLIEVLLVLVILVILASLAVTAYGPIQERANIDAAKAKIGLCKVPLEAYRPHMNRFPEDLEELRVEPANAPAGKWSGPYIENVVLTDPWDNPIQYECPGRHNPNSYDIWSWGPNMIDGDEDDIGNWQTE